ncbi:TPA: hypothetical protein QCX05_003257 [Bacillus pacificus]|uniref:hypothetical protein n=1 Tax=Bacillus pacificus TaxID=2026187 RepID=UPI00065C0067|nr:hypothetical protein TU53_10045 [Bacillus cereus]HDR7248244.1 hypothetical protein [Bacillus pacificus]
MKKEALIDTTETIEKIRELTDAANECSDALIRLDGLISKWNKKNDSLVGSTEKEQFIIEETIKD